MQFEISDEAAIVFAGGFYRPLATGSPVDTSLAAARLAMLAERGDDIEWGTPVLFMRVPDGRIFDLGPQGRPAPAEAQRAQPALGARARDRSAAAPSIFINYRHGDTSGHALLLADRLRQQFGPESVHLAVDHGYEPDRLAQSPDCSVLLVLIGPEWLSSLRTAGNARHAEDFARGEVERALRDVPDFVIPVLIDAAMPAPEALPRSLRALVRRDRAELRHATFERDLAGLIARVQSVPRLSPSAAAAAFRPAAGTPAPRSPAAGTPAPGSPTNQHRTTRVAAGVPEPYADHYADVIEGLVDGTVVPLLGTGASGVTTREPSLSTSIPGELHTSSTRLAEVAQRVAVTLGERRLYTAIKDVVAAHSEPDDVHRFLAELPCLLRQLGLRPRPQLIINANYDSALERAFEDANEPFDYAVYLAASGWFVHVPWGERDSEPVATTIREPKRYVDFPIDDDGELERTIIVKIHGGLDGREGGVTWRNNYVVTEDHYIDYLPTNNIQDHLPIQILDKLTGSRCLFLGYRMGTWNGRVFLRRIWRGKPISENSWAIQEDPDPLEKASWSAVGHVELLAARLTDYATALRSTLVDWRRLS
jgi:hypothetical protein